MSFKIVKQVLQAMAVAGLFLPSQSVDAQLQATTRGRQLAPDALHVIAPAMEYGETFQGPVDIALGSDGEQLNWTPNEEPVTQTALQQLKGVTFRGTVHCLEFAFKPVRMIEVTLPTEAGPQRKLIWYLIYRVRYLGNDYRPAPKLDQFDNQTFETPDTVATSWVRFMPNFTFQAKGKVQQRTLDQVLPAALPAIEAKERIGQPLYDSLSIQRQKISISDPADDQAVWGVATWADIDSRVDYFSVEVRGLTNAQQIVQEADQLQYLQKILVLNFFRPGDLLEEQEDQIRYGVPAVNRVDGLREELKRAIANREYELSIVSGGEVQLRSQELIKEIAQSLHGLGAERIRTYGLAGGAVFSLQATGQEKTIQDAIQRQLGIGVKVVDRAIPLGEVIRKAELAGDERQQEYVLEQYGLKERLDYFWTYR
ncbi:MAG: hypothetical protein KF752_00845 [Pirellulaceae bacterium]|nr:hypothetical protein [Pirellulaceae bacterium]